MESSTESIQDAFVASAEHLSSNALNQGYYSRFFREQERLGRGFRGSVFRCRHVIDNVVLGDYAVKKIPVGIWVSLRKSG